jgi:hypothetical protein
MAAIAAQTLIDETKCYTCTGAVTLPQQLRLGLLRRTLLAAVPTADVSMQGLTAYAKCYACYGATEAELLELALLDQIAQA